MKRSRGVIEMELNPMMMIRRIVPWMERRRKGEGRNPNPKDIMIRKERIKTCQRLNVFTITGWDIVPQVVCIRRLTRIPHDEWQVKL